jgi:hypothetical protein
MKRGRELLFKCDLFEEFLFGVVNIGLLTGGKKIRLFD